MLRWLLPLPLFIYSWTTQGWLLWTPVGKNHFFNKLGIRFIYRASWSTCMLRIDFASFSHTKKAYSNLILHKSSSIWRVSARRRNILCYSLSFPVMGWICLFVVVVVVVVVVVWGEGAISRILRYVDRSILYLSFTICCWYSSVDNWNLEVEVRGTGGDDKRNARQ